MSKYLAAFGLALGLAATSSFAIENVTVGYNYGTGTVDASGNITTSATWTADKVYQLSSQIYVTNGATLTIEAGTQIRSTAGGSLAIARGSKIIAIGTANNPIVFTSDKDVNSATQHFGGDGSGNPGVGEWGNLTLMGKALIGEEWNAKGDTIDTYRDGVAAPIITNSTYPTGVNLATMEGLTAAFVGDGRVLFGGADDNDDSGTLAYVSLRYGGKITVVPNAELNGLSMGGIGRETDVHHIDIFQNIDDGIETWGGTVNYKYLNIWYVGDDSFDVDDGWRGKAQFGLIVQGFGAFSSQSDGAAQGSGIGDNAIEIDGAQSNIAVPTTTAAIYNFTVIGQPDGQGPSGIGSDHATAWRDNARVQYRNMLFMKIGQLVVLEEPSEGSNPSTNWRYGQGSLAPYNTTPNFNNTTGVWAMSYRSAWLGSDSTGDADYSVLAGGHPSNAGYLSLQSAPFSPALVQMTTAQLQALYQAQSAGNPAIGQGKLCEITDSLFWSNANASAYTNADTVGVTVGGASNPAKGNVVTATQPIKKWVPGTVYHVTPTFLYMHRFGAAGLDPRLTAMNSDTTSISAAPNDGFFTPALYRGAFSDQTNWCLGWTAADKYGLFDKAVANPVVQAKVLAVATSFYAAAGKTYVIESSTDGINWTLVQVVAGTDSFVNIGTYTTLNASTLYRVSIQ
ncbi:MAG: autotransporter outer membrane beta-barrel domain-containing protein [Phycisphaerales bacterium]